MNIKTINCENFHSFSDLELNLNNSSIIIENNKYSCSSNGSGKQSVVDSRLYEFNQEIESFIKMKEMLEFMDQVINS